MDAQRVVVIGAGGVGGWLLRGIAPMLEYKAPGSLLLVVDGDNFEEKNKERQDFKTMGNKATVRAMELSQMYPATYPVPIPKWLVASIEDGQPEDDSSITPGALFEDGDIVFCVVDNFAARALCFDHAKTVDNIDVFTGGNDEALAGSVYHYQRRNGADVTDHPSEWHPELLNPPDRNPGELSCQERAALEGGTQFLATNMTVAALLLGQFQHKIIDNQDARQAGEAFFDLADGIMSSYDRPADEAGADEVDGEQELLAVAN